MHTSLTLSHSHANSLTLRHTTHSLMYTLSTHSLSAHSHILLVTLLCVLMLLTRITNLYTLKLNLHNTFNKWNVTLRRQIQNHRLNLLLLPNLPLIDTYSDLYYINDKIRHISNENFVITIPIDETVYKNI